MDDRRFDNLTKRLAAGSSRRGLLRGLAVIVAGGLAGARPAADTTAQAARKPNGAACARATDCASLRCAAGVCCNAACTGQCESCASGTCAPVAGDPVGNRPACPGTGPCRATCDGATSTRCAAFPGGDVACGAATCSDGWLTTSACGGNGSCVPTATNCAPYGCDPSGAACASGCAGHDQCPGSSHCAAGVCVGDQPLGGACADGAACIHGVCANGVCCNEPCDADCRACGADGFCGPAADGATCRGGLCCDGDCVDAASDVAHCGACHNGCAGDVCQGAVCAGGVCVTQSVGDGTPCGDGNACTGTGTCQAGVCGGGNPVVCTPLDACHDAGVCDPATGVCSNPPKANGAACNDDNSCTQTDACDGNGACVGGNPVTCPAADACHDAGTCDAATGQCGPTPITAGRCFVGGTCYAAAVVDPANACQVCDPTRSQTSFSSSNEGGACDDGDQCTIGSVCRAGACAPGTPVVCTAFDQCHVAGVCDPATGRCTNPDKADGIACDDGDDATCNDACQGGICAGGPCGGEVCSPTLTCPPGQECCGDSQCYDPAGNAQCASTCEPVNDTGLPENRIVILEEPCKPAPAPNYTAIGVCLPDTCLDSQVLCPSGQLLVDGVCRKVCGSTTNFCRDDQNCCGSHLCCDLVETQQCIVPDHPALPYCQQLCPGGVHLCGGVTCCTSEQTCVGGVCKTTCGLTTCFPDSQTCCPSSICCTTSTQVCGTSSGTCRLKPTCTATEVYVPPLNICCEQANACGDPPTECCDVTGQTCTTAGCLHL